MNLNKVTKVIKSHLEVNSIILDEELDSFFKKHLDKNEENLKDDNDNNKQEKKFIYNLDDFNFEADFAKILNNYKVSENGKEISINIDNNTLKFNAIKLNQINELFKGVYLYYEFFLSKDFDIRNIDINKLSGIAANMIMFFKLYTDEIYIEERNFIKILYNLISLLNTFQRQISNLDKKNDA